MRKRKYVHFLETNLGLVVVEEELKDVREDVRELLLDQLDILHELREKEPKVPYAGCPGCGRMDC